METLRNALNLNTTFARIEFWAFTTIFAFVMFFFIMDGFEGPSATENAAYRALFNEAGIPYDYYKNFYIPQLIRNLTLFISLIFLNFIAVPKIVSRQDLFINIGFAGFSYLVLVLIFGVTDYYLREFIYARQDDASPMMLQEGFAFASMVLFVFFIYTIIKYLSLYFLSVAGKLEEKYRFIRREAIVATFIWLIILLILTLEDADGLTIAGWVTIIPTAILLYLAGFYTLIPTSLNKKYPFIIYALKNALILFLILMAWGVILKLVVGGILRGDVAPLAALWMFNSVLQMFITVPITWLLYKRHMKGNEQLDVLKKELGQSY